MLPNKLKNTASEEIGNGVFFAYGAPYALLASFPSTIIDMAFSVEIIEKEILASNASVATNAKKHPNRCLRPGRFSGLLRLRPNPRRTQNVF